MDDVIEIDLRKIIETLLKNWLWIAAGTIVVGLGAFLFSFLQPRVYIGSAVVAITKPRYIANFDPRFQTVTSTQLANKIVMDIATSDEIEIAVFNAWQDPHKKLEDRANFREKALEAKAGADATTTILLVKLESAEEAARLANFWADLVVRRINTLYSGQDEGQLIIFETQIENSKTALSVADTALSNFEGRNQTAVLTNRLNALLAQQAETLQKQRLIADARRDAESILAQIEALAPDQPVPASVQRNFSVLQMRYYAAIVSADITVLPETDGHTSLPQVAINPQVLSSLQLQISDQSEAASATRAEMSAQVSAWEQAMAAQEAALSQLHDELSDDAAGLQEQIQKLRNERQRLEMDKQIAEETLATLTRKYQELRITMADSIGDAQVATTALPRQKPESRNTVRNTAIGLVLGGFLSIFGVLALDWWRKNSPYEAAG